MIHIITDWVASYGYVALGSLLMLGIVGLPIPDEVLLSYAGLLVYEGRMQLAPTLCVAVLGSWIGITVSYVIGLTAGKALLHTHSHLLHVSPERLQMIRRWFAKGGKLLLTFGYFLPGIRHATAIFAGVSGLRLGVFMFFAYSGGLIWATTFILLGRAFGREWFKLSDKVHKILLIVSGAVALAILIYMLIKRIKKNKT